MARKNHSLATRKKSRPKKRYARSFSTKNAMLEIATPLFTLISTFKNTDHAHDTSNARKKLLHAIKEFHDTLEQYDYDSDKILLAYYTMSAYADDAVIQTEWGKNCDWQKNGILTELPTNMSQPGRFFIILDKLCQNASEFIDNIELMYLCLRLGFEDHLSDNPIPLKQQKHITEIAYAIIQQHRGEFDKTLSPAIRNKPSIPSTRKYRGIIAGIIIVTVILLGGMYTGIYHISKISVNIANQQLERLHTNG